MPAPFSLKAPAFAHFVKFLCGPYCARFVLEAHGLEWEQPYLFRRFPRLYAFAPTLPGRMARLLSGGGLKATCVKVPLARRLWWLQEELECGNTPALFVRGRRWIPFSGRWIVVCGETADGFLVYDCRVGCRSRGRSLPIGNTVLSEEELLATWRRFPFVPSGYAVTAE